jgi:S-formylglutathione hydrolase
MYSYVTRELPEVVNAELPARPEARSIMGHSMGGHGALVCAFRNASVYRSVSAFAPIAAPMHCPWGSKAFTHYLGSEQADWRVYDASELVADHRFPGEILIDEGAADPYRVEQLLLDRFESAAVRARQPLRVRRPAGYDHGYYFIQTFMADHLRHHAAALLRE